MFIISFFKKIYAFFASFFKSKVVAIEAPVVQAVQDVAVKADAVVKE